MPTSEEDTLHVKGSSSMLTSEVDTLHVMGIAYQ